MTQKVTVYLDEKGIPALGELVTQSVLNAICANFNTLMERGLVTVKLDYTQPEVQDIFGDDNMIYSMKYPTKPTIRLIPQPGPNGAIMLIEMPS